MGRFYLLATNAGFDEETADDDIRPCPLFKEATPSNFAHHACSARFCRYGAMLLEFDSDNALLRYA